MTGITARLFALGRNFSEVESATRPATDAREAIAELARAPANPILPPQPMARTTRRLLFAVVVALVAVTAGLTGGGCVERELQVNSDPQGALVYLNDQEVGRTPLRQDFTWYGTYDVAVRKEGYQTLKTTSPVIAPWWQWVPFDFVADILPFRLKDSHALHYTLKPTPEIAEDPDRLVQRGQAMRDQLESGEKPLKTPKPRPAATTRAAKSPRTLPTTAPASQSLP